MASSKEYLDFIAQAVLRLLENALANPFADERKSIITRQL